MHAGEASGRAAWPVQGREEGSVEGSRAEAKTARAPGQGSLGSRALPRGSRGNPLPLGALRPADRAKPSCRVSAAGLRTLWGEGQSRLARNDRRPIEPRAPGGLAGRRSNWTLSRHPESSLIGTWKNDLNSTTETNSVSNKGMSSGVYEMAVSASDNPIRPSLLQIIQRQDPGPVFGFTIIFNLSASFRPLSGEQEGNGTAEDNLATAEGGGIRARRLGGAQRWSQHLLPQQVRG
ncbi:uncharacterized protein LOC120319784 isoform X2 [Crotalus tigris]|uniref:uncharacterized protein LOC120319784 isoform X2 n=1 Tax=Crotalus tigris TaxID=88082 RepID=UPI00192FB282|nr:uncharacterized protein LOC120319784 isoform X2 [Crotalus tigris]